MDCKGKQMMLTFTHFDLCKWKIMQQRLLNLQLIYSWDNAYRPPWQYTVKWKSILTLILPQHGWQCVVGLCRSTNNHLSESIKIVWCSSVRPFTTCVLHYSPIIRDFCPNEFLLILLKNKDIVHFENHSIQSLPIKH